MSGINYVCLKYKKADTLTLRGTMSEIIYVNFYGKKDIVKLSEEEMMRNRIIKILHEVYPDSFGANTAADKLLALFESKCKEAYCQGSDDCYKAMNKTTKKANPIKRKPTNG